MLPFCFLSCSSRNRVVLPVISSQRRVHTGWNGAAVRFSQQQMFACPIDNFASVNVCFKQLFNLRRGGVAAVPGKTKAKGCRFVSAGTENRGGFHA
jgi:hypothetical protein